jgi:M6 family metalloprotease-like protein
MKLARYRLLAVVTVLCLTAMFVVVLAQSRLREGGYEGQFMSVVADFFDNGYSETYHVLRTDDGREYQVVFGPGVEPPAAGSWVKFAGRAKGDTLYVDRVLRSMLPTGLGNSPIGEQRFVIALIRFQNDPPGNENVSIAQVQDKMFNPAYSVTDWFDEASYGKTFATGDVYGWFTLPMDRACNAGQWRTLVIPMLDALTDLTQYNRLYILVPQAGGCSWGGLGTLGASTYSTNDGPWTTTTSWTRSEYFNETLNPPRNAVFVTAHEVGHNFSQHHGNGLTWATGEALGGFNCDACGSTNTEYSDQHSAMGGAWRPGHHNADHKRNLGWFNPGNLLDVTHSGIYELSPYENDTNLPIALKILRGWAPTYNRFEYVMGEWRQPIGYDAELNHMSNAAYNGLFMHWDFRTNSTHSYDLDMTPGDNEKRNAPLPFGQTWTDPYTKLSVTPLGIQAGKLRVQVVIGDPVVPTSFLVVRGNLQSGGLAQIANSDNDSMAVRAGLVLSPSEPPVWVEFTGTLVGALPAAFRFEFEGRTNTVLNQRVQMFNYTTGQWDQMSSRDSTTTDSWVEADVWTNPGRYIQSGTGQMRARVQLYVDRLLLVWPFTASFDQAVWKVLR